MGKKKNKIVKITEEEYFAYINALKNDGGCGVPDKNNCIGRAKRENDSDNNKRN